jgi:hypothetical protein
VDGHGLGDGESVLGEWRYSTGLTGVVATGALMLPTHPGTFRGRATRPGAFRGRVFNPLRLGSFPPMTNRPSGSR